MKKYKQVAICLAAFMSFCSVCNFPAMQLLVNAAVDTEITDGVTSVVPWSSDVFRNCYGNIHSVSIKCSVDSVERDSFAGCKNLTYIRYNGGVYTMDSFKRAFAMAKLYKTA